MNNYYYGQITMLGHKKLIESFLDDELSVLNEKCEKTNKKIERTYGRWCYDLKFDSNARIGIKCFGNCFLTANSIEKTNTVDYFEIELEVKFENNIDIDGIINIAKKYNADILIHAMNEDEDKEVSIHIDKDGKVKRKILIDESIF